MSQTTLVTDATGIVGSEVVKQAFNTVFLIVIIIISMQIGV